jgi:Zn-finger nucleic acid-binding protein
MAVVIATSPPLVLGRCNAKRNSEEEKMINCPKCDVALENKDITSLSVDICPTCEGIWFEKDELRQAKDITDSDLNWLDFEIWKNKDKFKTFESAIKCPECGLQAVALEYGETGVEIDYCLECKGVWLDNGEFIKIIEALTRELLTKTFPEYIRSSLEEAKDIITGPESLISEWQDFATVLRFMQYRLLVEKPELQDTLLKIQERSPFK